MTDFTATATNLPITFHASDGYDASYNSIAQTVLFAFPAMSAGATVRINSMDTFGFYSGMFTGAGNITGSCLSVPYTPKGILLLIPSPATGSNPFGVNCSGNGGVIAPSLSELFSISVNYPRPFGGSPLPAEQVQFTNLILNCTLVTGTLTGGGGTGGTGVGIPAASSVLPNSCIVTLTRPWFRDAVRRKMGIPPPIDTGFGLAGEEPPGMGYPGNNDINQALDNAIGQINRASGFHSMTSVVIPVTPTTSPGAQAFTLMGYVGSSTQAIINDVRRVVWDDGISPQRKLNPTSYLALDRANVPFDAFTPSTPRDYYIEGYQLFLTPASSLSGNLRLYCGTGISNFCSDTDMLDELPNDYLQVVENIAVYLLRIARPTEPNAAQQIPLYAGLTKAGLSEVKIWANTINQTLQSGIIYAANRRTRR